MRPSRALILLVFACLLVVLVANGGVEALLTVLPLAGLVALLLSGRYVGEKRLLRRYEVPPQRARRHASAPPRPRATRARSVFARNAIARRGPPATAFG